MVKRVKKWKKCFLKNTKKIPKKHPKIGVFGQKTTFFLKSEKKYVRG